jgi:hypothetical protein
MNNASGTERRQEIRQQVEMLAHFRHDVSTITVMLKDLTCHGARIEGVAHLEPDQAIDLSLPGMRPKLSFVA